MFDELYVGSKFEFLHNFNMACEYIVNDKQLAMFSVP